MKVKDLVGKVFKFKIAESGYESEPIVGEEYVEGIFRIVIDCSFEAGSIITISYFEADEKGKLMEQDGELVKSEKTFTIAGSAALNIIKELEQKNLVDDNTERMSNESETISSKEGNENPDNQ